jgi:hypothetical protein
VVGFLELEPAKAGPAASSSSSSSLLIRVRQNSLASLLRFAAMIIGTPNVYESDPWTSNVMLHGVMNLPSGNPAIVDTMVGGAAATNGALNGRGNAMASAVAEHLPDLKDLPVMGSSSENRLAKTFARSLALGGTGALGGDGACSDCI